MRGRPGGTNVEWWRYPALLGHSRKICSGKHSCVLALEFGANPIVEHSRRPYNVEQAICPLKSSTSLGTRTQKIQLCAGRQLTVSEGPVTRNIITLCEP